MINTTISELLKVRMALEEFNGSLRDPDEADRFGDVCLFLNEALVLYSLEHSELVKELKKTSTEASDEEKEIALKVFKEANNILLSEKVKHPFEAIHVRDLKGKITIKTLILLSRIGVLARGG